MTMQNIRANIARNYVFFIKNLFLKTNILEHSLKTYYRNFHLHKI